VFLPSGVSLVQERVVLVVPHIQYDQLLDTMFHMIRQSAAGNAAVLMRQQATWRTCADGMAPS